MNVNSIYGRYAQLFSLNSKLFLERFKLDTPLIIIGLAYVFGTQSQLDFTVGKGVFLLVGFVFIAIIESQIIKRNTANLSFFLKLPIHKKMTLALFYISVLVPNLLVFTGLYFLLWTLHPVFHMSGEMSLTAQRYFQVIFAFLFIKSLTINTMIAMNIHLALIAGYFGYLAGALLILSILRELVTPIFTMNTFTFALLFLLSTYLSSFVLVKRIGLR
ncbi:MAG: hypothetical protein JSV84_00195 [Gemmatimonadota bacterium]|nr:MAG: hypothetical protein JSV84_00195 [Gemmatimonadota bacterium]